MHWDKSPKEKPCFPQRTVKKLLEEKRKRETASEPSPCSATRTSPVPPSSVPACSAEEPLSSGMAVGYEHWAPGAPGLDSTGPFGYYSSSPAGVSAAYGPAAMSSTYSTLQPGFGDAMMGHAYEFPMTSSWAHGPPDPQAGVGAPQAGVGAPQAGPWGPLDAVRLQEARTFLTGMDYTLSTTQDEDGDTILHIYTAKGLREYALAAAERLRDVGRLDAREHKGKTALLVAVTANQPAIVADLLALGSDAGACDVHGQTALHLAAKYGFPAALQVLLVNRPGVSLEARNFEGLTPLHVATMAHGVLMKSLCSSSVSQADVSLQAKAAETFSCVEMLLNAGANLSSQEIKSNKTALHLAVKDGNMELVRYLLACPLVASVKDFVNMRAHGHTALHMAAGLHGNQHQEEMLRLLLSKGADASVRNQENHQPVHLLQPGPHGERLKLLLKKRGASSTRRRALSLQDLQ